MVVSSSVPSSANMIVESGTGKVRHGSGDEQAMSCCMTNNVPAHVRRGGDWRRSVRLNPRGSKFV